MLYKVIVLKMVKSDRYLKLYRMILSFLTSFPRKLPNLPISFDNKWLTHKLIKG